jgi:2-polyprenyl-3-methyl-5-hydroxy-6-metoxy-1,4-benzoquinol methylase
MQFEYKDLDEEGLSVLDVISSADSFNRWMYETIVPFCPGTILEIGSGIGNISQFFIKENKSIFVSDIRLNYRNFIKNKFDLDGKRVIDIDIADVNFQNKYSDLLGKFDSVFCLNVVEHIEDDNISIANMMQLLKTGGKLTVLVPAYHWLYNGLDVTLNHYRRYNKKSLVKLMSKHGVVFDSFYFNAIGILGWFVSGKLFKNKTILQGEMKLYNSFVPLFKLVDRILFRKIGLSVVCVIKKTT